MKQGLFVVAVLLCRQLAVAQTAETRRGTFYSINSIGLIRGAAETAFEYQTVNGFQKNRFFIGLGIGMDRYRYAGIPVFVDGRFYTSGSPAGFFLYEDAGVHYVTQKTKDAFNAITYTPGYYNDAGIGVKLKTGRQTAVVLSAGWTYKNVRQTQSELICPFVGPCYTAVEQYRFDFSRLLFKLGLGF